MDKEPQFYHFIIARDFLKKQGIERSLYQLIDAYYTGQEKNLKYYRLQSDTEKLMMANGESMAGKFEKGLEAHEP